MNTVDDWLLATQLNACTFGVITQFIADTSALACVCKQTQEWLSTPAHFQLQKMLTAPGDFHRKIAIAGTMEQLLTKDEFQRLHTCDRSSICIDSTREYVADTLIENNVRLLHSIPAKQITKNVLVALDRNGRVINNTAIATAVLVACAAQTIEYDCLVADDQLDLVAILLNFGCPGNLLSRAIMFASARIIHAYLELFGADKVDISNMFTDGYIRNNVSDIDVDDSDADDNDDSDDNNGSGSNQSDHLNIARTYTANLQAGDPLSIKPVIASRVMDSIAVLVGHGVKFDPVHIRADLYHDAVTSAADRYVKLKPSLDTDVALVHELAGREHWRSLANLITGTKN